MSDPSFFRSKAAKLRAKKLGEYYSAEACAARLTAKLADEKAVIEFCRQVEKGTDTK
jgi:hypothetical protein